MNNDIQLQADFTLNQQPDIQADFTLNQQPDIQADFTIITTGADWGQINGDITNQTDLINLVNNATSTYTHEQGIASDTWVIEHNLDKHPSVTVVDTAGTVFTASVEYDNDNVCTVYINGATKGKAYLN